MTKSKKGFSRRKFLVRTAIGVGTLTAAIYVTRSIWRRSVASILNSADGLYLGDTKSPLLWFEVTKDNQVVLYSPKVEMGQGTFTGLAQLAADELEVDMKQISVRHAPSDSDNVDGFATGGSTSISGLWLPLRELAATMREMLLIEAAKLMQVNVAKLSVEKGVIKGDGQSLTYGEVVDKVSEWEIPETPQLKKFSDFKLIGKPIPRVDLHDKVLGAPIFGMDASLPGMLFGSVVRSSKIGAKFKGADVEAARNMPGVVKIIQEPDFVGVVAKSRMEAENAKSAIKAYWEVDQTWTNRDIENMIEVGKGKPIEIQKQGKAKKILDGAEDLITAQYKSPIGAHAQIEPNGALVSVEGDQVTVIISTQVVNITRREVAKRLGVSKKNVNVIPTYLGGGFGRRLHTPNAIQAAVMSKAVGKPVKCFFNRQEEFQNDTFRPPTHHVLKAKLSSEGFVEALEHNVSSGDVMFGSPLFPGFVAPVLGADVGAWRGGMIQYEKIPNLRAVSWRVKLPFATSWWRSLGLLANTFAIESFMDELAERVGRDPIQFRLDQIQDDEPGRRLKEVIKVVAQKAEWSPGVSAGRAMGFAASTDANTPCAQIVEVSVEDKQIKIHKVTCVIDPGLAVNPDQIRAQCEGSIIMGISASMHEQMRVVNGELQPTIYGPYKMALMKHAPREIDVVILENAESPGAVGEPPLGPIGAAIANAVYQLTKVRLREMPLQLV